MYCMRGPSLVKLAEDGNSGVSPQMIAAIRQFNHGMRALYDLMTAYDRIGSIGSKRGVWHHRIGGQD